MAETSYLWDNPNTGDSPAGGYGNSLLCQVIFRMLFNGTADQGVLLNWLNDLEVTDGGGLNAAVDTGGALCYGVWYENDSATTVACPNNSTVHVVVRASWAAQTARLTQVAALTQTAGVTYDIPLAEVTTAGGAITLITDERDYCEFTTEIWPLAIDSGMIDTDAATIAKMIDQDRWLDRGSGTIEPDVTNPCAWVNFNAGYPYRDAWNFVDAAQNGGWITFRVPADISSANIAVHVRTNRRYLNTGDVRWCYSAWKAQPSAILANSAACTAITYAGTSPETVWRLNMDATIGSFAVSAGDIVHCHIYRDGADAADTLGETVYLHLIRLEYTADS